MTTELQLEGGAKRLQAPSGITGFRLDGISDSTATMSNHWDCDINDGKPRPIIELESTPC